VIRVYNLKLRGVDVFVKVEILSSNLSSEIYLSFPFFAHIERDVESKEKKIFQ
tara:strand:- start:3 stop:161 length:159 start_codon:yes stop_codon:yes gene_type:complete